MPLFPEIEGLDLKKLMTLFAGPPLDGDEFGAIYYQALAVAIRKHGAEGINFLISELEHADENRLRGVLVGLTVPPLLEPDVGDLITAYLADNRPLVVADAIRSLSSQDNTKVAERVLDLARHPSGFVRGAVLDFAARLVRGRAKPLLTSGLQDPDYVVRESAADAIGDFAYKDLKENLLELRSDPNPDVRQAVETALKQLNS